MHGPSLREYAAGARRNGKDVALQKPGKQLSARNSFPGSVEGQSSRRLAIDGFGHHETPAIVRVSQPAFGVLNARLTAHRDKQGIVEFLRPGDVATEAMQMLDLLLEYFADGRHWTRGRFYSHGRHCLVGALNYLRREHRVASGAARYLLEEAIPRGCGRRLVYFNDHRCRSIADLRSVIVKARALALQEPERERAAAAAERWLLAEAERERAARTAAGDQRPTYTLCTRTPGRAGAVGGRRAAAEASGVAGLTGPEPVPPACDERQAQDFAVGQTIDSNRPRSGNSDTVSGA